MAGIDQQRRDKVQYNNAVTLVQSSEYFVREVRNKDTMPQLEKMSDNESDQPRPFRMMTVGSDTKLSVSSDFNLNRQLSVDSDDDEDAEDEVVPVPPDGGWGWVVVFAGFMVHFLLDGINYTFGILLNPIVSDFQSDAGTVVWAGSLLVGVNMLSGE